MKILKLWDRMNRLVSKHRDRGTPRIKVLWRKWRKVLRRNGVSGV